jgi:hypothetical protein
VLTQPARLDRSDSGVCTCSIVVSSMARLTMFAPPPVALFTIPFIYNIIFHHPALLRLIQRRDKVIVRYKPSSSPASPAGPIWSMLRGFLCGIRSVVSLQNSPCWHPGLDLETLLGHALCTTTGDSRLTVGIADLTLGSQPCALAAAVTGPAVSGPGLAAPRRPSGVSRFLFL